MVSFFACLALGACTSPTVPDLPTEEEEQDPNPDDDDIGFLRFQTAPTALA